MSVISNGYFSLNASDDSFQPVLVDHAFALLVELKMEQIFTKHLSAIEQQMDREFVWPVNLADMKDAQRILLQVSSDGRAQALYVAVPTDLRCITSWREATSASASSLATTPCTSSKAPARRR